MGSSLSTHEITELLQAWNRGEEDALGKLTPLVYAELYASARRSMARGRRHNSLQTTALINELYVRMVDLKRVTWQNRAHFFAVCARLMRNILIDIFRSANYQKRGGGLQRTSLDAAAIVSPDSRSDLVAIDEALTRLAELDARKGRVVEMRFFGGLSVKETAEVLKVSQETVLRDWKLAKAWLLNELSA
jgi:RNA polymerase sigma factor (TIGR02999 family)